MFTFLHSYGQESQFVEREFESAVFGTKRKVRIFIPEQYFLDSNQKFAVTYILDAQSDPFWYMASGNFGYLVRQLEVIPSILVGIVSENRGAEFSPLSQKLNEHLEAEVFPLIENEFRTENFRILVGHSWAGAFVANTLFSKYKDQFDAYLGISPSLGAIDGRIFEQADSILSLKTPLNKFFYCSSGDLGIMEYESGEEVATMDTIVQKASNSAFVWKRELFPNTDHWSCVIPSINNGLLAISRNYFPDEKVVRDFVGNQNLALNAQIDAFLAEKEKIYGYAFHPPAKYWETIADNFSQLENPEAAKELYLRTIREGKDESALLSFKLLQAFKALGDEANVDLYWERTSKLLEAQKADIKKGTYDSIKRKLAALRK